METTDLDLTPLSLARLTPIDIARCVGVSRVTASLWMNKHNGPHHLIRDRLERFVDAVAKAVQAGQLPVPHAITRRERTHYLKSVLAEYDYASS